MQLSLLCFMVRTARRFSELEGLASFFHDGDQRVLMGRTLPSFQKDSFLGLPRGERALASRKEQDLVRFFPVSSGVCDSACGPVRGRHYFPL